MEVLDIICWLLFPFSLDSCLKSSIDYSPKSNSPILYTPGLDPICQLDFKTFENTIFDTSKTNAFIVEFYADWCGHCRNFTPTFKNFANQIRNWDKVIKVATINCADSFNTEVCCKNGIQGEVPTLKYFPRNAKNYNDGLFMNADDDSSLKDLINELLEFIRKDSEKNRYSDWENLETLSTKNSISVSQNPKNINKSIGVINCSNEPEKCKQLYFVSETDILKASYLATLGDVKRKCDFIQGQNFTDLFHFVKLLSKHFPEKSRLSSSNREENKDLERSRRAKQFFGELKKFLDDKSENVSVRDYKEEFEKLEDDFGHPFPIDAAWEHCQGSAPHLRGYTCGLWTLFHTLTIHTYLNNKNNPNFDPLNPLQAIQGWIRSYLWCKDCREHFMNMTAQVGNFSIDKKNVNTAEDVFLYLWQAHNKVNKRLQDAAKVPGLSLF